jgi:hypothetical protein
MACWFNPANDTTRLALLSIEDSTGAHRFELRAWGNITGKPLRFGCAAGGSEEIKQIRQQVLLQINGSMRALLRQAQLAGLCI